LLESLEKEPPKRWLLRSRLNVPTRRSFTRMATAVSLLANPCNSAFDQQHHQHQQQHHHQLQQHFFPPFGAQIPETLQHRYSSATPAAGGGRRSEGAGNQCFQLEALDFHLLSRTIEEEIEQMEYSGSSSSTFQYHQHDQQQPQQQNPGATRRPGQGQQDFEQIPSGYNLENEDTYSGSPNNFQDYQNNFVDSPPDSKEPWPVEYGKMHTAIASTSGGASDTANASTAVTAVAVATAAVAAAAVVSQQQQQQQTENGSFINTCILPSRKRRMEWMQEEDTDGSETKIANIDKERDARRKGKWPGSLRCMLGNQLFINCSIEQSQTLVKYPIIHFLGAAKCTYSYCSTNKFNVTLQC
uniref:Uncharacterized protein n=1 Tax=Anopheles atroparvus TaxID=41427 RepID=A0A182JBS6_ANOAO